MNNAERETIVEYKLTLAISPIFTKHLSLFTEKSIQINK